jgi:hypothetical protein
MSVYNDDPRECLHGKCCFAGDNPPVSKVLSVPCDTLATAKKDRSDRVLHFNASDNFSLIWAIAVATLALLNFYLIKSNR